MNYLTKIWAMITGTKTVTGPERIAAVVDGFNEMIGELSLAVDECEARSSEINERVDALVCEHSRLAITTGKALRVRENLRKFLGD